MAVKKGSSMEEMIKQMREQDARRAEENKRVPVEKRETGFSAFMPKK